MWQGMVLCQSYALYHGCELQGERKDDHCCDGKDFYCLCYRYCKDPSDIAFQADDVHKQYRSAGHDIVNDKIPVVCPVEHSKEHCCCQNLRHQKLFHPEFPTSQFLHRRCCVPYLLCPGIQKSQKQKDKHDVYHMCVKVSQYEGVAREFMDRLVRHIRVESDITGGIREPVSAHFLAL